MCQELHVAIKLPVFHNYDNQKQKVPSSQLVDGECRQQQSTLKIHSHTWLAW